MNAAIISLVICYLHRVFQIWWCMHCITVLLDPTCLSLHLVLAIQCHICLKMVIREVPYSRCVVCGWHQRAYFPKGYVGFVEYCCPLCGGSLLILLELKDYKDRCGNTGNGGDTDKGGGQDDRRGKCKGGMAARVRKPLK